MQAIGFDPKKFTYTTKDPELLNIIEKDFELESQPIAERIEKLDEVAKSTIQQIL